MANPDPCDITLFNTYIDAAVAKGVISYKSGLTLITTAMRGAISDLKGCEHRSMISPFLPDAYLGVLTEYIEARKTAEHLLRVAEDAVRNLADATDALDDAYTVRDCPATLPDMYPDID